MDYYNPGSTGSEVRRTLERVGRGFDTHTEHTLGMILALLQALYNVLQLFMDICVVFFFTRFSTIHHFLDSSVL